MTTIRLQRARTQHPLKIGRAGFVVENPTQCGGVGFNPKEAAFAIIVEQRGLSVTIS